MNTLLGLNNSISHHLFLGNNLSSSIITVEHVESKTVLSRLNCLAYLYLINPKELIAFATIWLIEVSLKLNVNQPNASMVSKELRNLTLVMLFLLVYLFYQSMNYHHR